VPKVTFLNEVVTIEVPAGATVRDAADRAGLSLFRGLWPELHCGTFPFVGPLLGDGSCNRCKVWVTPLQPGA